MNRFSFLVEGFVREEPPAVPLNVELGGGDRAWLNPYLVIIPLLKRNQQEGSWGAAGTCPAGHCPNEAMAAPPAIIAAR